MSSASAFSVRCSQGHWVMTASCAISALVAPTATSCPFSSRPSRCNRSRRVLSNSSSEAVRRGRAAGVAEPNEPNENGFEQVAVIARKFVANVLGFVGQRAAHAAHELIGLDHRPTSGLVLLPCGAQRDLQKRQVARLVGDVARNCLQERFKCGLVALAGETKRLADAGGKTRVRNAFEAQDRVAAIGVEALEERPPVGALTGCRCSSVTPLNRLK